VQRIEISREIQSPIYTVLSRTRIHVRPFPPRRSSPLLQQEFTEKEGSAGPGGRRRRRDRWKRKTTECLLAAAAPLPAVSDEVSTTCTAPPISSGSGLRIPHLPAMASPTNSIQFPCGLRAAPSPFPSQAGTHQTRNAHTAATSALLAAVLLNLEWNVI
jgi:hypothetical protein